MHDFASNYALRPGVGAEAQGLNPEPQKKPRASKKKPGIKIAKNDDFHENRMKTYSVNF